MDFAELACQPEEDCDLLLGAALIARDERPQLDPRSVVQQIDALARPLGSLVGRPLIEQAEALAWHLHQHCGFRGDERDYYDPRNSYIDAVLVRRTGIPITLSLVYMEVGRRAGLRTRGVGFPGHFLVRIDDEADSAVIIDPFGGGRLLEPSDLRALLSHTTNGAMSYEGSLLRPVSSRRILIRMLLNLRTVHANRGDFPRLMVILSRLLELDPSAAREWRDRGLLAARLGAPNAAIADLNRYLEIASGAGDAAEVRSMIAELSKRTRLQN